MFEDVLDVDADSERLEGIKKGVKTTLTRLSVSSMVGNSLILQVIGISTASTKLVRIRRTFSGCVSNAAPIPPFKEKDLGQPMFTSMPSTSRST